MILILGGSDDDHIARVTEHLSAEAVILDLSQFPVSTGLSAKYDCPHESVCGRFLLPDGTDLHLGDVGAVWYRRIRPFGLHENLADETARLFAWSESNEAILGIWYSLECYWMNPPLADEAAQRKVRQLQVARQVDLPIPETLITNEPTAARDFVLQHGPGNIVRKAFRNIAQAPRETLIVDREQLDLIDSVQYAPVIFQRYVPADLDLRVTVVEDEIFAAAIESEPEYQADYRVGLATAVVKPYTLPDDVADRIGQLMRVLGLNYGAIDMRVMPDGHHVFLEINPAGEWLFISERTGQPIPAAIAASLERHQQAWQGAAGG
jgi:glutathione synthase/RimK-type ligase-like ATP-grasp enzyme